MGVAGVEDRLEDALGEVGRHAQALGRGAALGEESALASGVDEREVMPALGLEELADEGPATGDDLQQGPVKGVDSSPFFQKNAVGK